MEIPRNAKTFVYTCPCGKSYKVYSDNFTKKNPFEFICLNCKRKIVFKMIDNGTEKIYTADAIIEENLLSEIKL